MVVITSIDETRFAELARPLIGLPITAAWLSDYTALYLEIGPLTEAYPNSGRPKAEHTAYFGFHWVLESQRGQESSSLEAGAATRIANALIGQRVAVVRASSACELVLELASHKRMRSNASHVGEPEWTLFLPSGACIAAAGRSLVLESRAA